MADLQDVRTHLEFQGYRIEPRDQSFRAIHERYLNFLFKGYRGGVLFTIMFRGSAHAKSHLDDFRELVNALNVKYGAARAYVDKDGDFIMEAYHALPYQRAAFASFLEVWQMDTVLLFEVEQFRDYIE